MGSIQEGSFSAPTERITTQALLFDFDGETEVIPESRKDESDIFYAGTIIDSTAAIVKHWHKQGKLINVDPETILATSHGRRSIDVFKVLDPSKANWDYISEQEALIPVEFGNDAEEIPGARNILARLDELNIPWAVVTSGTRALVNGWVGVLKLTHPKTLVVAEEVSNGKPDPEPYILGRDRLGFNDGTDCVVFEDAPSGIQAGKAAGFRVIALATTHTIPQLKAAGADWILRDLQSVTIASMNDGLVQIDINNALTAS